MFFGGFSFINGAQFQQLVQNIMQNKEVYALYKQALQTNYTSVAFYVCRNRSGVLAPESTPFGSGTSQDRDDPLAIPVSAVTAAQDPLIASPGLIYYVYTQLNNAVQAIANGTAIPASAIQLMQVTPLPVYQMVNIAAVYPGAAEQLVKTYSVFIATLLAQSIITNWMQQQGTLVSGVSADEGASIQKMQTEAHALLIVDAHASVSIVLLSSPYPSSVTRVLKTFVKPTLHNP